MAQVDLPLAIEKPNVTLTKNRNSGKQLQFPVHGISGRWPFIAEILSFCVIFWHLGLKSGCGLCMWWVSQVFPAYSPAAYFVDY